MKGLSHITIRKQLEVIISWRDRRRASCVLPCKYLRCRGPMPLRKEENEKEVRDGRKRIIVIRLNYSLRE